MVTEFKISVHEIVDFTLRCGDIDNRRAGMNSAAEGSRIHRLLQKKEAGEWLTEVSLSASIEC